MTYSPGGRGLPCRRRVEPRGRQARPGELHRRARARRARRVVRGPADDAEHDVRAHGRCDRGPLVHYCASLFFAHPCIFLYLITKRSYTGRCVNDFTAHG
jgi:hypothetical protein